MHCMYHSVQQKTGPAMTSWLSCNPYSQYTRRYHSDERGYKRDSVAHGDTTDSGEHDTPALVGG